MATSSFWHEDRYRTHFFCALCGGPFARVYRTDVVPEYGAGGRSSSDDYEDAGLVEEACSIPADSNRLLTQDELKANVYPRVGSELEHSERLRVEGAPRTAHLGGGVRRAYDGRYISERDLRWTRVIRALIHRQAQVQPYEGREQLGPDQDVYLTGRGSVLEDGSWAIAHPSIEHDVGGDDDDDSSVLSDADDNLYRFHMYQEPDRNNRRFQISSIPFHEECWDVFEQAVNAAHEARGLPVQPKIELKYIWAHWCELLPVAAMDRGRADLMLGDLAAGRFEEPITRFSAACMVGAGYREAQFSGSGKAWLHVPELHWLVANPQASLLQDDPFQLQRRLRPQAAPSPSRVPKRATADPFWRLPREVLIETIGYLSCVDTSCWRVASVPVHFLPIPQKVYRRFFLEEMRFLPALMLQMREHERLHAQRDVNWQGILDYASQGWRQDIRLRNRRRIWKIVEPMADELVERSSRHLKAVGKLHPALAAVATVARGNVGVRSGILGRHETVVFSELFRQTLPEPEPEEFPEDLVDAAGLEVPSESNQNIIMLDDVFPTLKRIDVWLHPRERHVCGLQFVFFFERTLDEPHRYLYRPLGRCSAVCQSYVVDSTTHVLTGFNVFWARGRLSGIQLVYEDDTTEPTEYREHEMVSERYGRCDGPVRRLVAPRLYRLLAGVTAFVSGSGLIEMFAIIEKKKPQRGPGGILMDPTPDTVPLTHREASLWASLPPNDVILSDRLGPRVDDWRLRMAQCEVFAPTSTNHPPGDIHDLTLFSDGDYLVGISFRYRDRAENFISRELGECTSKSRICVSLEEDEQIILAIVGHGNTGILSLQLVTSLGRVHPACGARYRGTHTIYILKSAMSSGPQEMPGGISYISSPIIGFHCLYSSSLRRLIQLGIVTRADPAEFLASSSQCTYSSPEPLLSPHSETGWPFIKLHSSRYPWVDGPPPRNLVRGRKDSDPIKTLKTTLPATFAGWVSLRAPISRIVIYGQMEGIKISYLDGQHPHTCFGNTSRSVRRKKTRFFGDTETPFQVIARSFTSGDNSVPEHSLPTIRFLKPSHGRAPDLSVEVDSPHLAAVEFSFTADALVDWQPLFDYRGLQGHGASPANHDRTKSWKSRQVQQSYPLAEADRELSEYTTVLVDFFVNPSKDLSKDPSKNPSKNPSNDPSNDPSVDGVKGYVSTHRVIRKNHGNDHEEMITRFCGLCFRRRGLWDEEPLGKITAYEHVFLLSAGETFVSVHYSASGRNHPSSAFAMSTNLGRTTPWFGHPGNGINIEVLPPSGRRAVGIYMAYSDVRQSAAIGIIHDEDQRYKPPHPGLKPSIELFQDDPDTELAWILKPSWPPGARFQEDFDRDLYQGLLVRRAATVIVPEHLVSIEAYTNTNPGRYGLRALRFRGHAEMGTVLLGDWDEERVRSIPEHRMLIDGGHGERIIKFAMTIKPYDDGQRIIGMVITTNHGREHDIVNWRPLTDEPPPSDKIRTAIIQCAPQREVVVGFTYLTGSCIHEIEFITQKRKR